MEASYSGSTSYDPEARVLEGLFDIFGATVSLKEIASAFCKTGCNPELAAEILLELQGCTSSTASDSTNGDLRSVPSSELSSENLSKVVVHPDNNIKESKQNKIFASAGTVSSIIGKGYSRPPTSTNGSLKTTKPKKIHLKEIVEDEVEGKDVALNSKRTDLMHRDIEDFLFKMLGDGFQLGMDVIQHVLGSCGYDANKTIEKLVDLSASSLTKCDDIFDGSSEKCSDEGAGLRYQLGQAKGENTDQRSTSVAIRQDKRKSDLENEVLASLFNVPERVEEPPKKSRPVRAVKKTRASFGTVVGELPVDTNSDVLVDTLDQQDVEYEVEEDNYDVLRRATKEHWITMKEYYKAAAAAHATGNYPLADELLKQGKFYDNKAREADEKSAKLIVESRDEEKREEVVFDVHDLGVKEAIRTVKHHLSLAGVIKYLKVIVDTEGGVDDTKGARKQWIIKLLEKKSFKWTEQDNGRALVIQLD